MTGSFLSTVRLAVAVATIGALAGVFAGCVTERVRDGGRGPRKVKTSSNIPTEFRADVGGHIGEVSAGAGAVSDGRAELDAITAGDPCGNRVHALAGSMLLYYAVHRQLPVTLDALRGFADADEELNFICPTSGQAYVYEPAGLVLRGTEGRLVLYDAEPAHDGARWGVVAAPPRGTRPATATAVRLSEATFRRYAAPPQVVVPSAAP